LSFLQYDDILCMIVIFRHLTHFIKYIIIILLYNGQQIIIDNDNLILDNLKTDCIVINNLILCSVQLWKSESSPSWETVELVIHN